MTGVLDPLVPDPFLVDELDAPAPARPARTAAAAPTRPGHWFLATLLAGAGAIHLALAPVHLDQQAVLGAGFLVAAWAQVALAVAAVLRPRRWVWALALATSTAVLGAWLAGRTAGLPFGLLDEPESVALVDGTAAALEGMAVISTAFLLVRPRAAVLQAGPLAAAAAAVVLVATTAAIASPSARGHEHVDDGGFAALQNGQMAGGHSHGEAPAGPTDGPPVLPGSRGELAGQLALTAPLVASYPTLADAEAAGYRRAGPFAPGLGVHYMRPDQPAINPDGAMDPEDIAAPTLIYAGLEDDAPLAGFMYLSFTDEPPTGFAGPLDEWHYHTDVCTVTTDEGIDTPFGADGAGVTKAMCDAEGGTLLDFTGYMVHVWTVPGYESPLGTFSELNPKLPCPDGTYHQIPLSDLGDADTTCLPPS